MKITDLRKVRGYTLVEVMVSMLIAFIVLGGVYQTISRETLDMNRQEIILDMQNNARVAVDRITSEIRRAGFFGCGGTLIANTLSNKGTVKTIVAAKTTALGSASSDPDYWRGGTTILAALKAGATVDYLGAPLAFYNNATATHPLYDPGTDALSLVYLGGDVPLKPGHLLTTGTATTKNYQLSRKAFAQGDIIYITDCREASLFQKTNSDDTLLLEHEVEFLNNDKELGNAYGAVDQARVFNLKVSTFFVSDSKLKHNLSNRTIASDIEDLQFELLYDLGGSWSTVLPTVDTAFDVRAIRVSVLARSEVVNDYTNRETYSYAGKTYTANDHRYRYLASSVVYLRNAGI